jgi:uncharacterized protein YecE (DUF72 family)
MGDIRVGISGWTYPPWRGLFYPRGLRQKDELAYACSRLNSLEINGTFYGLQRPASYMSWRDQAPEDFVFAVKAPRFITHIKRLKDVRAPVANFFANGPLAMGPKLGPILWQLPPSLRYDRAVLEAFLELLPRDTHAAAKLARGHDERVAGRVYLEAGEKRPLRHALEVRHASFDDPAFFSLLRAHRVALVTADTAGKWPFFEEPTSDFAYARLHGDEELYVSGYTPAALRTWAAKVRRWSASGRDVYVYFDNDAKVRAPFDAMALADRLSAPRRRAAAATRRRSYRRRPGRPLRSTSAGGP